MPEDRARKRIDATLKIASDKFAVWKHYEERPDRLGDQLWSVGAWLIALVGTTVSVPFVGSLVKHLPSQPHLQIDNRGAVVGIAIFGIMLSPTRT